MDRYMIEDKIGEGCFGTVHRGIYTTTGCPVALKKVPINRLQEGLPNSAVRELISMQHLRHENVLQLMEVFPSGSSMVLVTELCATDLASVLKNYSALAPMPMEYVKTWLFMILKAVAHCHALRILHRDIKPSNLLLSQENMIKLGDFGLARVFNPDRSDDMTHEVATRWYRAPELLFGERRYGPEVDMWGVGCVFAEMLYGCSGAVLFPGEGDIDQITKIFRVLGTPTEESWPGVSQLPDWDKILFQNFDPAGLASRLPSSSASRVSDSALDLLSRMVTLDPKKRISATEALHHDFFLIPPRPVPHMTMQLPRKQPKLPTFAQVLNGEARRAQVGADAVLPTCSAVSLSVNFPPLLPFLAPAEEAPCGPDGVVLEVTGDEAVVRTANDNPGGADRIGQQQRREVRGEGQTYLNRNTLRQRRRSHPSEGSTSAEDESSSSSCEDESSSPPRNNGAIEKRQSSLPSQEFDF